jgi:hypothetical protein
MTFGAKTTAALIALKQQRGALLTPADMTACIDHAYRQHCLANRRPCVMEAKPGSVDPCFDALAEVEGGIASELTPSGARINAIALGEIRKVCPGVTPEEIRARAKRYSEALFKGCTLTAPALAKHWSKCAPVSPKVTPLSPPRPIAATPAQNFGFFQPDGTVAVR